MDDIVLSLDLTLANWDTLYNLSDLSFESVLNSQNGSGNTHLTDVVKIKEIIQCEQAL